MESKGSASSIEAYIQQALVDWQIPGGAVSMINNGEIISSRGYGSTRVGSQNSVNEETLFSIGSCSKAFTAAVLGLLVDEGVIKWDDKVVVYLPDICLSDPDITTEITIRDLLCHRSGLKRSIRLMNRDKVFDSDDYISRIAELEFDGAFRTRFGYNNSHYIVAGKIVETVTGKRWKEVVQERLFGPIGMTTSYTTYQDMIKSGTKNISSGHANLEGGFVPAELRVLDPVSSIEWTDYGENPAGSIISNLKDMTRWLQCLLDGGEVNGQQILSKKVLSDMISPQMLVKPGESEMDALFSVGLSTNILSYGLGWYVMDYRGHKMVFHPGQVHGFISAVAFLPELKIGGVILLNTYQTMLHPMLGFYMFDKLLGYERDYSGEMKNLVAHWRVGAEMEIQDMLSSRPEKVSSSLTAQQVVGTYTSELYGDIQISLENNRLFHRYGETSLFEADLEIWEDCTYLVNYHNKVNPQDYLTFIQDSDGEVNRLVVKDVDQFNRKSSTMEE
ncbi:MAG: serine hydrolase [Anaerolineaceae bacterium]|nr:serine hydrolase [Anaerolineaceae bacterium]